MKILLLFLTIVFGIHADEEVVVSFKKGEVLLLGETPSPLKVGDQISKDAKVQIPDKGRLDLTYNGKEFRSSSNGVILVSDILSSASEGKESSTTKVLGVRGQNAEKVRKSKPKKKKKSEE